MADLEKIAEGLKNTDPVHAAVSAYNKSQGPQAVIGKMAGGDKAKFDTLAKEHDQFVRYNLNNETYHTGSFAKGFANSFANGVIGGEVFQDRLSVSYRDIHNSGGSFKEFANLKAAAGESIKDVEDGAEKQKLKVTMKGYEQFSEKVAGMGIDRKQAVANAVDDLKKGKTIEQSTKELDKEFAKDKRTGQIDSSALEAASKIGGKLTSSNITKPGAPISDAQLAGNPPASRSPSIQSGGPSVA